MEPQPHVRRADEAMVRRALGAPHDRSDEHFDRLDYLRRALDLLGASRVRTAMRLGERLDVRTGIDFARSREAAWAIVQIPRDASRRAIALCALEIARPEPGPMAARTLWETSSHEHA